MENVCVKTREDVKFGYVHNQDLEQFIGEVFEATIDTFRFTEEEKAWFIKNDVAKLIAAIPFVAGCSDAMRTSLAHLAIYMTELRGGSMIFDHSKDDNDTVYTRLRLISSFKDGDEKLIQRGMNLLALCMIKGYKRSSQKDIENNIYNPLNDGAWNYEELVTSLENDIRENPCEALDSFIMQENGMLGRYWAGN